MIKTRLLIFLDCWQHLVECSYYFKTPFLFRSLRLLGIINTESTQSPPLECVQSICFMENLTSVAGSESVTINSPTLYSIQHPLLWLPFTSSWSVSSIQNSQDACWPSEVDNHGSAQNCKHVVPASWKTFQGEAWRTEYKYQPVKGISPPHLLQTTRFAANKPQPGTCKR